MSERPEPLLELKQQVSCSIDGAADRLHRLSRDIWSRPELAYRETEAHERLAAFFSEEGGWTVERRFKLDTAFRARWRSGGGGERRAAVTVGFLCEYDALPGIGHACGHNLIAEVGAAAAVGLRAALEDAARRREQEGSGPPDTVEVVVLGTPAEEDGGGKIDLIGEGAFDDMDVVFMAHPLQYDAQHLPLVAEHDVSIKYHGKASHASAYPWEGVNALDAAVLCYSSLSALRQQMKPDWRVHGIIKHGGEKPNIIPAFTQLEYYLRAPCRAELSVLKEKAEGCFRAAAVATGCTVEVEYAKNAFDNLLRNRTLEELYAANGKALGMEFTTDKEVLSNASGSTDFGNVSFVVPGIHPYFYIGSKALNHTEEYTAASGDDAAQFFTLRTAKALAMTALDLLLRPELLQKVKQEFSQAKVAEEERLR
ncbi:peptidase M20 domain-containing protein 2 isoform X1 [Salarias fasciatus]|uniref:Peptidase M20 domain-containing protein 2 n=1 Tax=Salarias fasciatus TaxID=181472 RepID=A0A672G9I3_SALFA|nr:peptidase M20 domain-containing protein 2 isoform X1 [Salarias fasciatus]